MEKVDDIRKQVSNVSSKIETLRKDQKEMSEIKKHINRNENAFNRLISKLNIGGERINKLQENSIETFQTEMKQEKKKLLYK